MKIRIGYDIAFSSPAATATILMLSVHSSRLSDLTERHRISFDPRKPIPITSETFAHGL